MPTENTEFSRKKLANDRVKFLEPNTQQAYVSNFLISKDDTKNHISVTQEAYQYQFWTKSFFENDGGTFWKCPATKYPDQSFVIFQTDLEKSQLRILSTHFWPICIQVDQMIRNISIDLWWKLISGPIL